MCPSLLQAHVTHELSAIAHAADEEVVTTNISTSDLTTFQSHWALDECALNSGRDEMTIHVFRHLLFGRLILCTIVVLNLASGLSDVGHHKDVVKRACVSDVCRQYTIAATFRMYGGEGLLRHGCHMAQVAGLRQASTSATARCAGFLASRLKGTAARAHIILYFAYWPKLVCLTFPCASPRWKKLCS
jgi:hypothetical protein